MAISSEERRFLRSWEEQRNGGKWQYVGIYTIGFTVMLFLGSVALGLFMSLPFVKLKLLIGIAVGSVGGAFLLSLAIWGHHQKRFHKIIKREIAGKIN